MVRYVHVSAYFILLAVTLTANFIHTRSSYSRDGKLIGCRLCINGLEFWLSIYFLRATCYIRKHTVILKNTANMREREREMTTLLIYILSIVGYPHPHSPMSAIGKPSLEPSHAPWRPQGRLCTFSFYTTVYAP